MEDIFFNQWYCTPFYVALGAYYGYKANEHFKAMKSDPNRLGYAVIWSIGFASTATATALCVADGLEKLLN